MHCQSPWFEKIQRGEKPVEGRKGTPKHRRILAGDLIRFTNGTDDFLAEVLKVDSFASLDDYLSGVGIGKALPGIETLKEGKRIYHQWSTPEEIKQYGFLGIWVKPLKEAS